MKKMILLLPVIILIYGFVSARIIDDKMKNILQQVDMSEKSAQNFIWSGCSGPSFYYPNPKQLKNAAAGKKAEMVSVIGKYVKEYTSSPDFLNKYNEYRENHKPRETEKPMTMAEMKNNQKTQLKAAIENFEKMKTQMPDQKDMLEQSIKTYKQQLKDIDDPNNPMYSPEMEKQIKSIYDQQMVRYNEEVAQWEKEYPAGNPKPMIKEWLQKFLEISSNIDFKAQLADADNGKKVFVNKDYERKSNDWKLFFRAGKETVNAGREFAQNWLKELK